VSETGYLRHLAPDLPVTDARIACHYLGRPTEAHAAQRLTGRGTALVAAAISASATVQPTWPKVDRDFDWALKRRHQTRANAPGMSTAAPPTDTACSPPRVDGVAP